MVLYLFLGNNGDNLLRNSLDLRHQALINKLVEVETTNVVEEAEVQATKLETREIKSIQETDPPESEEVLELLELEDGVEVKDLILEQDLEAEDVEVVEPAELEEKVEIEAVEGGQVLDVEGVKAFQVVDEAQVEGGAVFDLPGGRGGGQGGKSGGDDGGGLHFCGWVSGVWVERVDGVIN